MRTDVLSTVTRRVLFAPLDGPGRTDLVAERLRTAIMLGVLAEDDQLPAESALAAQFNISPVTLRDALAQLRELGLVTTRRGRGGGTVVNAPTGTNRHRALQHVAKLSALDFRDLNDWRRAIGTECARLAAQRAAVDDIASLERASANFALARGEDEARRADSRYFVELAAASQSVRLSSSVIKLQIEYSSILTLVYGDASVQAEVAVLFGDITDAVKFGRSDAAGEFAATAIDLVATRAAELRMQSWGV